MPSATRLHPRLERVRRSRSELALLEEERAGWVAQLAPEFHFHRLFDCIPGVFFFAKDRAGRTMFASKGILQLYRMSDEREMLGLTDFDLNPEIMASGYVTDDQQLLASKTKRVERLELWFDRQGLPDWFVVIKLPLHDRRGRRVGVMGVLRRAGEHEKRLPVFQTVSRAVEEIRRNFANPISIAELAGSCGVSVRQIQRRFQSAFGITPQEFIVKTRVLAAAQLLEETNLSAAEIGDRCGFADPSAFAEQFHQRTGLTPTRYRTNRKTS
jgi:AraC-like DNA-binding protein